MTRREGKGNGGKMARKRGDKDLKPRNRPALTEGYKTREKLRRRKQKEYDYYYVSYEHKSRKKTAKKGKCKMPGCGKEFTLESWQHSTLHWCPACRNSPEYQNFRTYQRLNGILA